jgi:hypothetical protein
MTFEAGSKMGEVRFDGAGSPEKGSSTKGLTDISNFC